MTRGRLILILTIVTSALRGQEYCSHSVHSSTVNSSVSPGYSVLQNCYDVKYYDLKLEVTDTSTFLKGETEISFESLALMDSVVFELTESMTIDSIFLDNKAVSGYSHNGELVFIHPEESLIPGSRHRVKVFYQGGQTNNGFFSGLTNRIDNTYKKAVTYTLSEPFQASGWFPVKQNLEDKADSVRIRIITPDSLLAGSNGLLTSVQNIEGGKKMFT